MAKIEILSVGFYENNPGDFWCDGTEEVIDTLEIKGNGFPFAYSDRKALYGKALAQIGLRWSKGVDVSMNGSTETCNEVALWRFSKEYGGSIPLCVLRLVKVDDAEPRAPWPCSYDCGDCAQCRAFGEWADEQE